MSSHSLPTCPNCLGVSPSRELSHPAPPTPGPRAGAGTDPSHEGVGAGLA